MEPTVLVAILAIEEVGRFDKATTQQTRLNLYGKHIFGKAIT
jgi:hypothetical protein